VERSSVKFGLSKEDVAAMMLAQRARCAICAKGFTKTRPYVRDHDHRTGEVRGLLCSPCNVAIGEKHDKAEWFAAAAGYLMQPPARAALGRIHYIPDSPGAAGLLEEQDHA
jgi:hypothetical protein